MNIDEYMEAQAEEQARFGHLPADSLWKAREAFLEYKRACNRRPDYLKTLKSYLRRFIRGREHEPVSFVTARVIEDWFRLRPVAPSHQCAAMGRLGSFLTWAVRRKLIASNPIRELERPIVEHKPPRILTPAEARRLLYATWRAKPDWLAYVVIGLFCGVRPHEMHRLKFGDVCLKRGLVTVDAAASKTRMRRLVPLHGKAVAWLSRCQMKPDDPIVPQSRSQPHTTAIAQFAGLKWSHDLLRHSCASYMLALHQDAAKVSRWLGNSIPILTNHYMELVQPDDCRRFWKYRFEKTRKIVPPNATTTPQRTATQVPSVLWLDCSQTVSA